MIDKDCSAMRRAATVYAVRDHRVALISTQLFPMATRNPRSARAMADKAVPIQSLLKWLIRGPKCGALGAIRTRAHGSGGRCSIP